MTWQPYPPGQPGRPFVFVALDSQGTSVHITLGDEKNFSEFYLSLGRRQAYIRWRSEADSPEDAQWGMCLLLIDRALPLCLRLDGRPVLHGCAVDFSGRGAVFLGESGAGKSTLAAASHALGFPVLSEEAVVFSHQDGIWHIQPGAPLVRLRPGGRPALAEAEQEQLKALPWIEKFQLRLDSAPREKAAAQPAQAVYLLQRQPGLLTPRIEALSQADGLKILLEQRYGLAAAPLELGAHEFSTFSSLRRQAALRLLHMPDNLAALPQVVQAVAADLQMLA